MKQTGIYSNKNIHPTIPVRVGYKHRVQQANFDFRDKDTRRLGVRQYL